MTRVGDIASTHIEVNAKGERVAVDNDGPNPNYIDRWSPKLKTMTTNEAKSHLDFIGYLGTPNMQWLHDQLLWVLAGKSLWAEAN